MTPTPTPTPDRPARVPGAAVGQQSNHDAGVHLDELARRIASRRATEALLFEHVGAWVPLTPEPALKPVLATWCARHAEHLDLWADRFPVVPHLDLDASTAAARAELAGAERTLSQASTTAERLTAAVALLERHEAACAADRAAIDPLLDAPTVRVLDVVLADLHAEIGELEVRRRHAGT